MTRVAAIDCGTNSLRLLIADGGTGGDSSLCEVSQRMEIVRLGQGVDRTGELTQTALARTDAVLDGFAAELAALRVERVRVVATSVLRDVCNADAFVAIVRHRLGISPEIVSGQAEGALAFRGATHGLEDSLRYPRPHLVIDIGGGSTELVRGPAVGTDGELLAVSMDVGAVRLTERYFHHDPPTLDEVSAARADVTAALGYASAVRAGGSAGAVIGVAGSVTTVAAIALGLTSYQPERLHHVWVDGAVVSRVAEGLLAASRSERDANLAIHPGRADVIAAGALILQEVLRWTGSTGLVVSEHDILHGIAYGLLAEVDGPAA